MFGVFEWFVLDLRCYVFGLIVLSDEPRQNQGRGLVDRKLVEALQLYHCWPSQDGTPVSVIW